MTTKLNLLRSVENNPIYEGPFDGLKQTFKHLIGKTNSPEPAQAAAEPETITTANQSMSHLESMITQLVETTDIRYVIFTRVGFLTTNYLKAGGGKGVIDHITDDNELLKVAKGEATEKFVLSKIGSTFKFSSLVVPTVSPTGGADTAIILNIPRDLSDTLEKAIAASDAKAARETLIKMMSFKFYVMSLKLQEALKIRRTMDVDDLDKRLSAFSPFFIRNFPNKIEWDGAKEEWADAHDTEGQADRELEKDKRTADRKQERDEVDKVLKGGSAAATQAASSVDQAVKIIFADSAKETDGVKRADIIMSQLTSNLKPKFKKDEVLRVLTDIDNSFKSSLAQAVIARLNQTTDWS